MALNDSTVFVGVINIDTSKQYIKENVEVYCKYAEEVYLKKLLGQNLYIYYLANLSATKWVNFLKVQTFEYAGISYTNDVKKMLAYFSYYEYVNDSQGYNSTVGEVSSNIDNAVTVNPMPKLSRAYNLGRDLYNIAHKYLLANGGDFEDVNPDVIGSINVFGI